MELPAYTAKELAQRWKTGLNVVNNLIWDGRLRPMRMPTTIIPIMEVERFEREAVKSQEDFSKYADKEFRKKYPRKIIKEEPQVVNLKEMMGLRD